MKALALCALGAVSLSAQVVTGKSYDSSRTSENRAEKVLTPENVSSLSLLPKIPCIGDKRGCEAQPVIDHVSGMDVMILASEANVVRGVVSDGGAAIWQTPQLCTPVKSDPTVDMWRVNWYLGIMSTPAVSARLHRVYLTATCSKDGSGLPKSMEQHEIVLDTATGRLIADVPFQGRDGNQVFSEIPRKCRSAALDTTWKGVEFIWGLCGSYSEGGTGSTGWIWGFDTYDNRFKVMKATSQGRGGGAWISGQGIIMGPEGYLYFPTGNGSYNATSDFGEAQVQVVPTYPNGNTPATLTIANSWARFSDAGRGGNNPALSSPTVQLPNKIAGVSEPTAKVDVPGALMAMAMPGTPKNVNNAAFTDQDDGLAHTLVDTRWYVVCGKDGVCTVTDIRRFPRTQPMDFLNPKANCAKVGVYQLGWNLGMDSCPTDMTDLNITPGGKTRHIHAPIVQYHAPDGQVYIMVWAENSPLQAWRMDTLTGKLTYVARSVEVASPESPSGMPGGFCSVSSNNGVNALAFCSVPRGDANRGITNGDMYAYDLAKFVAGKPAMIWKSDTYVFSKFSAPIVWNGVVILADYDGSILEWKVKQ